MSLYSATHRGCLAAWFKFSSSLSQVCLLPQRALLSWDCPPELGAEWEGRSFLLFPCPFPPAKLKGEAARICNMLSQAGLLLGSICPSAICPTRRWMLWGSKQGSWSPGITCQHLGLRE